MNPKVFKGPVFPIPTAFSQSGELDLESTIRYTNFLVDSGAKNLLVTVGTSRFNLLDLEEMLAVNQAVAQAGKAKGANVIVTNGLTGSLESTVQFAKEAAKHQADAMMVFYPERYYDDDSIIEFYEAISAESTVPLMIHEMPMRSGTKGGWEQYPMELLDRLLNLPRVIGMKEESGSFGHTYEIVRHYAKEYALILAGGAKRLFMAFLPFGADLYLVGVGSLTPKVALEFWRHIEEGRWEDALAIERDIEAPFFDVAFNVGWHLAMKKGLEYLGLMAADERLPLKSLRGDNERRVLQAIDKLRLETYL